MASGLPTSSQIGNFFALGLSEPSARAAGVTECGFRCITWQLVPLLVG